MEFSGVFTALVTPFHNTDEVDYHSLSHLIEFQISSGVNGFVVCGSTGEAATLSKEEYLAVIRTSLELVKGRVPIVAGINSSSTATAAALAAELSALRVNNDQLAALLVVTPPYLKPNAQGIKAHYQNVADAAKGLPIIAYNVPSRTGVNMVPETVKELVEKKTIVGVKESSGSMDQLLDLLAAVRTDTAVFTGECSLTFAALLAGAVGVISATANVAPTEFSCMYSAIKDHRIAEALFHHEKLLPLIRAAFIESNPVPVKAMLHLLKVIRNPKVRLPLTPVSPQSLEKIKAVLGGV